MSTNIPQKFDRKLSATNLTNLNATEFIFTAGYGLYKCSWDSTDDITADTCKLLKKWPENFNIWKKFTNHCVFYASWKMRGWLQKSAETLKLLLNFRAHWRQQNPPQSSRITYRGYELKISSSPQKFHNARHNVKSQILS